MATTGIQGFWNYDVFSPLGPMSGRPQAEAMGFINTWNFNLCFTQTDIVTKFHNNPPFITRAYNTGVDAGDLNFRGGVSLVGKNWIMNYEHCIIEACDGSYAIDTVNEIDPTRCINEWIYDPGLPETWTPPPGVFREMTKPDANTYEVTTQDHFVYRFSKNENIAINHGGGTFNYIYVLDYIEDRNGSRVYVEWEDMSATAYDDRIKAIQVSLDQGATRYDVIRFDYDPDEPGLISRYSLVAIDSLPTGTTPPNWFADMHWDFTYDGSDNLVKTEYPTGSKGRGYYTYAYDTDEFEITDMEGTKHSYYSPSAGLWYREIWAKDGVAFYARISYEDKGSDVTEITDPETSEIWEFKHDSTGGYITEIKDPDGKSHEFSWDANYQLSDITFPAIRFEPGVLGTLISKVDFTYGGFNLTKVEWSQDGDPATMKYTIEYTYDSGTSKNDLIKVEMHEDFTAGNYFTETQFEYDSNHNLILIRAGINPNITDATDPEDMSIAAVTRFTYTDEGSLDSVTGPEGNKMGFCYNSDISKGELGSLAKIKEYLSDGIATTVLTTYLEYYFMELRLKSVTTSGKTPTTAFSYNNIGELKLISISEGPTYETLYDKMGNPIELSGPDGTTTIDYDLKTTPLNLPCTIVAPSPNDDVNKITVAYDSNGLVNTTTFRYNNEEYDTVYAYDIVNRLTSVTSRIAVTYPPDPPGPTETVSFEYDDNSNLIKITDPGGNESLFFYNLVGNIIMACAPEDDGTASPTRWERVIFTYGGPMGLVSQTIFVYGPSGSIQNVHAFYYDRLGRLVRWVLPQVSYTRGETSYTYTYSDHFYYDRNSNTIMVINREYETSIGDPVTTDTNSYYTYDGFSRLVKACIEYEDEQVLDMCWYYDIYGNLLEVTEGGMKSVRMAYDDSGKLTGVYKPNQHSNQGKTYEYDKVSGKMTKKSSPGGKVTEMQYAPDGSHQSSVSGPAEQKSDDCGDKTGSTATQVIPGDNPDIVIGEDTKSAKTEYYENGWVKRIILPNGDYFGYSYDGLGRIITVYESVPEQDPGADDSDWPFGSIDDTAVTLSITYAWIADPTPPIYILKVTYSTYKAGGDYETRYYFNNQGRLEEVEFYVGYIQGGGDGWYSYTYTYDGRGNLTLVKYNDVTLVTNNYNHLGQLESQAYDNLTNNYEHSPFMTPTGKQEYSEGNETHFRDITLTFDKVLRMVSEVDTDNILTNDDPDPEYAQVTKLFEFHHDNASRIIRIKDPYYDSVGNDPLQTRIAVEESPYLRTIERTDTHNPVRGHAETYNHFYDEAGRLRKVDLPDITATGPAVDEGANQASVTVEYTYEVTGKLASVTVTSLRDDSQVYHIAYAYDDLGRMTERIVRVDSTDSGWLNWATFKYDGRSQLLDEKYTYSADGSSTTLVYQATNTYDLAGNLSSRVLKRLEPPASPPPPVLELVTYTFTNISYSRGYQLLSFIVTDDKVPTAWTYIASYDVRGNLLSLPATPATPPFTFPSFTYDSLNNVSSYTAGGTTWYLWRDALGRVFRKADSSGIYQDNATHYYYTFSALAQEYDEHLVSEWPVDDFEFDYLRGFDGHVLRRRDVEDADPDLQPLKDLLASPLNLVNADDGVMSAGTSGYTFDAWGESFAAGDEDGQPSETNHIRYHGAFTEEFVSPDDTDGVYRMGARHYSTVLGRFFQREPMTLVGLPSPANPLGVNAYLYSHNSPTTTSDISGLQMGMSSTYSQGILYPPEKPEVIPYEPLPDPDPGFEPPEDIGPKMPEAMEFRIPGMNPFPWWDRRNPVIPLPPQPGGISTMIMPAPVDPGPGTTPLGPPPAPGTPIINPPKNPWDGVLMGASSVSGDKSYGYWPPGSKWGLVGQHFQKGKVDTGSRGKDGEYGEMPNYGFVMGATAISGTAKEPTEADFDQAWKDQGLGWKLATPGLVVAGIGLAGIAGIGYLASVGNTWAMSIVGRSGAMRLFGLGRLIYNKGFNRLVTAAGKRYPKLAGNVHKHHIFPRYLQSSELWSSGGGGPVTQVDAAYHQLYTNAWRSRFAYGKNIKLAADELTSMGRLIHRKLPLPYGVFPTW